MKTINELQNEVIEEFSDFDYLDGQDSMVTVFEVQRDGLIGAVTFIYRKGELQTYYIGIRWREGGMPEIQGTSVSNVAEIKLTEKGYFIYAYEYVIAHASLRQYWRIEPLPEDCQELTEKYISGLSYVNYNLLVTDWDSSNVEDILMPCMYEDVYRISTGENLKTEGWKIPAEEYERIMTTYFPVSVEQKLQGMTPGVSISGNSGQPGANQSIRIRGMGSFNSDFDLSSSLQDGKINRVKKFNINSLNIAFIFLRI